MFDKFKTRFFKTVEATDCSLRPEETMNGQAFEYNLYKFTGPLQARENDTITATLSVAALPDNFRVSERIGKPMIIDAIAIFRTKEAFGMTECIGAAFGKAK
jgi:hypothetical protein